MPSRIGVDVIAFGQPPGAERQDAGFGGFDIVDHDIEVELLWSGRVRPLRRLVSWRALEGKSRGVLSRCDHHPVLAAEHDLQPEQLGVEGG